MLADEIAVLFGQALIGYEHIYERDASCVRRFSRLAQPVGLCAEFRTWIAPTLGQAIPR